MSTQLIAQSTHTVHPSVLPNDLAEAVRKMQAASKSPSTQRAYAGDWLAFTTWCELRQRQAMPASPETVAAYLAAPENIERLTVATLRRHLATISKAHQVAKVPNPCKTSTVADTIAGIRKSNTKPHKEAPGLLAEALRATLDTLGTDLAGHRDRVVLLVGWNLALRRSELAALTWGDISTDLADTQGVLVTVRRSKTDQQGAGQTLGLAMSENPARCPVQALETWRQALLVAGGTEAIADSAPILRQVNRHGQVLGQLSGQGVAFIITRRTKRAGLPTRYQGHSLRKGLIQEAKLAGVADSAVMATSRHTTVTMLRKYQGQVGLVTTAASKGLL